MNPNRKPYEKNEMIEYENIFNGLILPKNSTSGTDPRLFIRK